MPFINGKHYMNPAYGRAMERARARGKLGVTPLVYYYDNAERETGPSELDLGDDAPENRGIIENFAGSQKPTVSERHTRESQGHWVTINGRHVFVHEAQGTANQGQDNSSDKRKAHLHKADGDHAKYSIEAQDGTIWLYDQNGKLVDTFHYTTGRNGDTNPADKSTGPLPPGQYTIDPSEISKAGISRTWLDPRDWGEYRVPLHPEPGTNTHGRSGFFLHGGDIRPGSEGCLKVDGVNQNELFDRLKQSPGPVHVTVN